MLALVAAGQAAVPGTALSGMPAPPSPGPSGEATTRDERIIESFHFLYWMNLLEDEPLVAFSQGEEDALKAPEAEPGAGREKER
jgi:hypothetical protein